MNLTVRQAAAYLHADESTVRQWITKRGLPVHRVNEGLRLNALELWEWATEQGVPVSRKLLERARKTPEPVPPLSTLLAVGGIHHDVGGQDRAGVLKEMVARLPLPDDVDRGFLTSVLEAREAMGSTGIGDGIAIPHVRNPIVLHIDHAFVTLALLRQPVEFELAAGVDIDDPGIVGGGIGCTEQGSLNSLLVQREFHQAHGNSDVRHLPEAGDDAGSCLADRRECLRDMFSDDGLHPSEPSQRRLAKIIAGALTPSLSAGKMGTPNRARHATDAAREHVQ